MERHQQRTHGVSSVVDSTPHADPVQHCLRAVGRIQVVEPDESKRLSAAHETVRDAKNGLLSKKYGEIDTEREASVNRATACHWTVDAASDGRTWWLVDQLDDVSAEDCNTIDYEPPMRQGNDCDSDKRLTVPMKGDRHGQQGLLN